MSSSSSSFDTGYDNAEFPGLPQCLRDSGFLGCWWCCVVGGHRGIASPSPGTSALLLLHPVSCQPPFPTSSFSSFSLHPTTCLYSLDLSSIPQSVVGNVYLPVISHISNPKSVVSSQHVLDVRGVGEGRD